MQTLSENGTGDIDAIKGLRQDREMEPPHIRFFVGEQSDRNSRQGTGVAELQKEQINSTDRSRPPFVAESPHLKALSILPPALSPAHDHFSIARKQQAVHLSLPDLPTKKIVHHAKKPDAPEKAISPVETFQQRIMHQVHLLQIYTLYSQEKVLRLDFSLDFTKTMKDATAFERDTDQAYLANLLEFQRAKRRIHRLRMRRRHERIISGVTLSKDESGNTGSGKRSMRNGSGSQHGESTVTIAASRGRRGRGRPRRLTSQRSQSDLEQDFQQDSSMSKILLYPMIQFSSVCILICHSSKF
jgi:hypothetical protein